jgi:zeaxanthin glucosyltransferase
VLLRTHFTARSRRDECRARVLDRLMCLSDGAPDLLQLLDECDCGVENFNDIADLLLEMPEIVMFPREFVAPDEKPDPRLLFVSPCNNEERIESPFKWDVLDRTKKIVYCSLGSQSGLMAAKRHQIFQLLAEVMALLPYYQLIVARGKGNDASTLTTSGNIVVTEWVPQIALLKAVNVMVTHAGPGTVRECIAAEVPMLVTPLMRDQFACAEAVVAHGMGIRAEIGSVTPSHLAESVERLAGDIEFRQRVCDMREVFARTGGWTTVVSVIEELARTGVHRLTSIEAGLL